MPRFDDASLDYRMALEGSESIQETRSQPPPLPPCPEGETFNRITTQYALQDPETGKKNALKTQSRHPYLGESPPRNGLRLPRRGFALHRLFTAHDYSTMFRLVGSYEGYKPRLGDH